MNDMDNDNDELGARLRRLPAERLPPATAWPRIAARVQEERRPPPPAAITPRRRRWLFTAAAAAAVLALAGVNHWRQPLPESSTPVAQSAPLPQPSPLQQQADALTDEYQRAIAALPPSAAPAELVPALHELDASAGEIRAAIAQDPQGRFLLGQLQRAYALRLQLTRQGLASADHFT